MWPSALAGLCPQRLWPRTVVRPEAITSSPHTGVTPRAHSLHLTSTDSILVTVPLWSSSPASGPHRGKDTGPSSRGPGPGRGCGPPTPMLRSDSALPLARLLKGFRELHGDPKERPHPDHQDLQAGPSWTVPASLTQQVSLEEKGKGGWTQRGHGETEAEARGTVMSPGHLESRKL